MQSRWTDTEADRFIREAEAAGQPAALGLRVYTSRLIGQDPDLVLHGGGNTSVKLDHPDGRVIHVKGSGWDLGDIEAPGLPAMWLDPLLEARAIPTMSDPHMVAFLRRHLLDASAPTPSVEALLHAFLPHAFVDHTHATAILALADQEQMQDTVLRLYGGKVGFVPYVMPGYDLSHACDRVFCDAPSVEGLWLEKHGLFTFADTARESYERMIRFVTIAEQELAARDALPGGPESSKAPLPSLAADLLQAIAATGVLGPEPAMDFRVTPSILRLLSRPDLTALSRRGAATPDHVIRIKPFPLIVQADAGPEAIQRALADYAAEYVAYFERNAPHAAEQKTMLDTCPRAVLVPDVGILAIGKTPKDAQVVGDLWEQTARIVLAAETWGRFSPIREAELFEMEYWSLEQAKVRKD